MSIKLRTTLVMLALFLAALWTLAGLAMSALRESLEAQLKAQQFASVSYVAQSIDAAVRDRFKALDTVARSLPRHRSIEKGHINPTHLASDDVLFKGRLRYITSDGRVIASTSEWDKFDIGISPAFLEKLNRTGAPAVDTPRLSPAGQTPFVTFAAPVYDGGEKPVGFFLGSTPTNDDSLFGFTHAAAEDRAGLLVISPADKVFISATDLFRVMQPIPPPGRNAMHDRYMAGYEGSGVAVNSRGVEELSSAKRIPATDWFVVWVTPTSLAFAPVVELRTTIFGIATGLSLLLSLLTWFFMRRQLMPLEKLSRRIASLPPVPDSFVPLPLEGANEIQLLTREFNQRQTLLCNRMAQEIEKERADYAFLVEHVPVGVFSIDASGSITFANQLCAEILNLAPDAILGHGWLNSIHPDDRAAATALFDEQPSSKIQRLIGDGRRIELRTARHDADVGWIAIIVRPTPSANAHFIGSLVDISERIRRDQARRDQYAHSMTMLDNSVIGIVYLNHRRVVTCNARMEEMFGFAPGTLVGNLTEVLYSSSEEFERVGRDAYACVAKGGAYNGQLWLKRQDGSLFWGYLSGKAIDPAQPQEGSIWIYQDVTDQKLQHEVLKKYERAVQQSPVSIVITNNQGIIEYVNPAFTRITGYSRREAVGQNPRILQSGETPVETYKAMWSKMLAGKEWRGVLKNKRKDGQVIWEEVVIGPLADDDGHTTHYIAVKEDITARRDAELELDAYQRNLEQMIIDRTQKLSTALEHAKTAERAKDEFLANMSHEIRTPMNAIIGMSGLALRTTLDERQRDYVEKIHNSGEHLLGLINDILDLSKIGAGKLLLETEDFALADQITRILSILGTRASEKHLNLDWEIAPEVPPYLKGDALRLNQILTNLIGNAIKFSDRGRILLTVKLEEHENDVVKLAFAVTDNGIGISEEKIEQLFQPFSQGDASVTRRFGGTGLGLAICRSLVEMMGGTIGVSSRPGAGSTFAFSVRLAIGMAPDPTASTTQDWTQFDAHWRFENVRILIVDDQPMNRQIAEELLHAVGVQTDSVENGRLAVERLTAAGPLGYDLVLMDIQMPELDGMAATERIRAMPGYTDLPIVAMTAHVMNEERRRFMAAGMNDHIGKPFNPSDLIRIIATWLATEKKHHLIPTLEAGTPVAATPEADAGHVTDAASSPVAALALDLPGVDVATALPRFGGKIEKYRTWMSNFAVSQSHAATEIQSLLTDHNLEEARRRIHLIKGQSGTLGMMGVHAAATALENAVKAEAICDTELAVFSVELDSMVALCRQIAQQPDHVSSSSASSGTSRDT